MHIRIATIDNLSALAWRRCGAECAADTLVGPPSATLDWMLAGRADAALVPVAGLPALAGQAQPLGQYGIACTGAVHSVRVFSDMPLRQVLRGRFPVHVTEKSRTSRQLFQSLCQLDFGITPNLVDDPTLAGTRLLIGDESMDPTREEQSWPVRIDLGEWWHRCTGQPFVFARWVARIGLPAEARERISRGLEQAAAFAASERGVDALAAQAIREEWIHAGDALARAYYRAIRPRLTAEDLCGLRVFMALQEGRNAWAKSA